MLIGLLPAQYDEKQVLSQQAYQMMARRQYNEAEQLFIQLLDKYPGDLNSILQLIQIYYQTSQTDKIDKLLEQNIRHIPSNTYTEQKILLLIMQGKVSEAWNMSQRYLEQMAYNVNTYRTLAQYFERRGFYEQVIALYKEARIRLNSEDLFSLELANSALNFRLLEEALQEYLRFLDKNPANLYFVNNQCATILKEDSTLVSIISSSAETSTNSALKELLANSYVSLRQYQAALETYKSLPVNKIHAFAQQQFSALNDEIALLAFEHLIAVNSEPLAQNEYRFHSAQIHFRNGGLPEAADSLNMIIADERLQAWNLRNRSAVNYNARRLKAEIALIMGTDTNQVIDLYVEARQYARNQMEINEIDLDIAKLMLMNADFSKAQAQMELVRDPKLLESKEFYTFLLALLQNRTEIADSLMNEYIIKHPGGRFVNDAIYLMMLVFELEEADRDTFFIAYRSFHLHNPEAIDMLLQVFDRNQDEELRILAIEWAIMISKSEKALQILDYEFKDDIAREYAALLRLKLSRDSDYEQRLAREFLSKNPNSIFSPGFRQVLSRLSSARPNL